MSIIAWTGQGSFLGLRKRSILDTHVATPYQEKNQGFVMKEKENRLSTASIIGITDIEVQVWGLAYDFLLEPWE